MRRLGIVGLSLLALLAGRVLGETTDELTRATELIERGDYELARLHLDTIAIDPRLTPAQRSRAYYYRGFTFFAQDLFVSAAQDYARALEFDTGNHAAQTALAHLHAAGLGVDRDPAEAFRLFLKAARGGESSAQFYVGHALLTGLGVERDVKKARFWLKEASDSGHLAALVQLARSHRAPYATEPDPAEALRLYELAAARGSDEALAAIGFMHLAGELGEADPTRAASFFQRATERNSAVGMAALAHLYAAGDGVPRDRKKALELYERASTQGFAGAFTALGHMHENGWGVRRDSGAARRYYEEGAARGDVDAQLRLAELALEGNSREAVEEAIGWFRAAAAQGSATGQNGLAWLLATTRFDDLRDPEAALAAAQRAVNEAPSASTLDTLAAAYAEAGRFEDAEAVQREAIAAMSADEAAFAEEFKARLEVYRAEKAWRE